MTQKIHISKKQWLLSVKWPNDAYVQDNYINPRLLSLILDDLEFTDEETTADTFGGDFLTELSGYYAAYYTPIGTQITAADDIIFEQPEIPQMPFIQAASEEPWWVLEETGHYDITYFGEPDNAFGTFAYTKVIVQETQNWLPNG